MQIRLPNEFVKIIRNNGLLHGSVKQSLSGFSEIFTDNSLELFPGFTDHGVEHIQGVLDTCSKIITDDAIKLITPEDVYTLVCSVLLHDSAMHLTKGGLWGLLGDSRYDGALLGMGDGLKWNERWGDFVETVNHFDDDAWGMLFGEGELGVAPPEVGEKNITENQKVLLGEFVRRQHANIAQVIAEYGFPSHEGPIGLLNRDLAHLNRLSGFIARSHNYPLRKMKDILGDPECITSHGVHPTFLMGVLRIADYLQFEQKRTPKILFKYKLLASPISIKEWKKQLAIISSHKDHRDIELLYVEAAPQDAITMRDILNLLGGLQAELDELWAVLGEVYSQHSTLNRLGITIRRVRSNLDEPDKYLEMSGGGYYPKVLRIHTDDYRVYPLLVKPLYGDLPQVGLRELIQNSVDACKERYHFETNDNPTYSQIPYGIKVEFDLKQSTLTVTDEGVGMTPEVIDDYFLKIGASYRYSEQWKSLHMASDGESFIPRTGKFGVGVLAGFLVGDKVTVETRSIHNDKGVVFSYTLNKKEIELKESDISDIGTRITIECNKDEMDKLIKGFVGKDRYYYGSVYKEEWSSYWYFLDTPVIDYQFAGEGWQELEIVEQKLIKVEDVLKYWNRVSGLKRVDIYWLPDNFISTVYCNGVIVKDLVAPKIELDTLLDSWCFERYDLLVFDKYGEFPLNLQRNGLLGSEFYGLREIQMSIMEKMFAEFYKRITFSENRLEAIIDSLSALEMYSRQCAPFVFYEKYAIPMLSGSETTTFFVDFMLTSQKRGYCYAGLEFLPESWGVVCHDNIEKKADSVLKALVTYVLGYKKLDSKYTASGRECALVDRIEGVVGKLFVKKYDWDKVRDYDLSCVGYENYEVHMLDNNWVMLANDSSDENVPSEVQDLINADDGKEFMFAVIEFDGKQSSEYAKKWSEVVGECVIPYGKTGSERKREKGAVPEESPRNIQSDQVTERVNRDIESK